ncbi:ParB/RepB/Spo0J family partition protein [Variovorax sp. YR752]|uniref:ParB/RepB/Spo0J family partition protein n=1 Tax=Variovorax sp. YR752 TaxID=1884383 RepID=UPI0031384547
MPIMRMPWSKSGNLQLDLLDAPAAPEEAPALPAAPGASARSASMVPTASIYEDCNNPRTEIPEAELDELAEDIRQHGILQPIVVHPADAAGLHQIHFGAKRWRAAQRIGLLEVPVVVRDGPTNPYAQVAENQKRHGLTPLDLARFIRGRIDAGDSNTTVAKTLGLDLTTVAHHLALLDLPPVVDAAMKAGRCSSPRTLYELGRLHAAQPERVAELVAGTDPITRDAVAEIRDTAAQAPTAASAHKPWTARPGRAAQLLSRATGLCEKLDVSLTRLGQSDLNALPADDVAALRQRVAQLARRIDA